MFAALDISSSALVAQRLRLTTVAGNLANLSSLRDENGDARPYHARYVVFQTDPSVGSPLGAHGVKVAAIQTETMEPDYRYDPGHPLAIRSGPWKGYVAYPRVDMMSQMVDALEATRSYEANVGVMELTRNMAMQTLRILG